ncbi:hypothetical protein QAD02_004040 [Eretmocerus hayati]|uniref:Uncharacterized protein n=1 Tax=Eretmocerus hayati TaxID=131215 RepID=A0ACC2NTA7_9HYME|nr:hypothetical protein QAD02_004040 [Eretmocerus hayati]
MMRYGRLQDEITRRGGPQIGGNHDQVIRIELRDRPRILRPPAPGLMAGVLPFADIMALQNEMELAFFEALDGNQFLAVNGGEGNGPVILHVSGIYAIAPDARCIRRASRNGFGGWTNWWMHHLHITGLQSRITQMICPGCRELAFVYYRRHNCQTCLEVYHAHRLEILLGVVFEAAYIRVLRRPGAQFNL